MGEIQVSFELSGRGIDVVASTKAFLREKVIQVESSQPIQNIHMPRKFLLDRRFLLRVQDDGTCMQIQICNTRFSYKKDMVFLPEKISRKFTFFE